jgi:hypothetical protein
MQGVASAFVVRCQTDSSPKMITIVLLLSSVSLIQAGRFADVFQEAEIKFEIDRGVFQVDVKIVQQCSPSPIYNQTKK